MIKHYLTAAILICSVLPGYAQESIEIIPHRNYTVPVEKYAKTAGTAKTTAVCSRLIQWSHSITTGLNVWTLSDSTVLTYSNGRGMDLTTSTVENDSTYWYLMGPSGPYLQEIYANHFNAQGLADTGLYFASSYPRQRYVRYYYPGGIMSRFTEETWTGSGWGAPANRYMGVTGRDSFARGANFRTSHYYDAAGNRIQTLTEDSVSGVWTNSARRSYTWDAAGNLLTDVSERFGGGIWTINDRVRNTYNSSNALISTINERRMPPGGLQVEDSTTYTYSGTAVRTDTVFVWASSFWVSQFRRVNTFTVTGKPLTSVEEKWNGSALTNNTRTFYFYNSYDQLTRQYTESWTGSAWVAGGGGPLKARDVDDRYYYENYGPAGIIGQQINAKPSIVLSPVPAVNVLSIALSFLDKTDFNCSVTDATGRLVYSWKAAGKSIYTHDMNVGNLLSGTYYLNVRSSAGSSSRAFTVQH
jgi:hypothetical protein